MSKKLMRKKLAMMLATLKKKRKFFCEVEYLESTGTQYIDTGVIPSETVSYSWEIYAQAVDTGVNDYHWFIGTQTPWAMAGTYPDTSSDYTFYPGGGDYYQDGVRVSTPSGGNKYAFVKHIISYTGSSSNSTSITLFARRSSNGGVSSAGSKRIFCCKISKNNVLICDFIPVLDWDMTPCMYDKVSGRLFYNQGSGDFIAGREIHYVDYLENITSQAALNYIPTTYTPTTNTNVEAKVRYTGGASGATWAIGAASWWGIHYQGQGPKIGITNSSSDQYQVYTPYTAGNDITLKLDGSNVYADGTLVGSLTKQNASSTLTLFRYSNSANLSWVGRIYYLDIWDNNGYVYKFRPAIDETGKGYLFDQISHTIFDNAGTGVFSYPAREIEHLEIPWDSQGNRIETNLTALETDRIIFDSEIIRTEATDDCYIARATNTYFDVGSRQSTFYIRFGSSSNSVGTSTIFGRHIYELYKEHFDIDGITKATPTYNSISGDWIIGSTGSAQNVKHYSIKLINNSNNAIRAYFIPVFKDGVAGFLNKVDGTFFANAGTGQFLTGKIVEPEYE